MKIDVKKLLSTPKGKLIAALVGMGICWLFVFIWLAGDFLLTIPSDERIAATTMELRRQRNTYQKVAAEAKFADEARDRYRKMIATAWQTERDGMAETALRQKIIDTARSVELKLNSVGSVRTSRINTELYYAEIDITTSGTLDEITAFISAIQALEPPLSWRRLDIRPDNRQVSKSSSIVNLAEEVEQTASAVVISGALRVIGYDGTVVPAKSGTKPVTSSGTQVK